MAGITQNSLTTHFVYLFLHVDINCRPTPCIPRGLGADTIPREHAVLTVRVLNSATLFIVTCPSCPAATRPKFHR